MPRVIRGIDERGDFETRVFTRAEVADAQVYGAAGVKSGVLFIAGLLSFSLFCFIQNVAGSGGVTTVDVIPMDDTDEAEMGYRFGLGTLADGWGMLRIGPDAPVLVAARLLFTASTGQKKITAGLWGRSR